MATLYLNPKATNNADKPQIKKSKYVKLPKGFTHSKP